MRRILRYFRLRASVLIGLFGISGLLLISGLKDSQQLITLKTPIVIPTILRLQKQQESNDIGPRFNLKSVPYTDFSRSFTKSGAEFWPSFEPAVKCPSKLLTRIGGLGDGGKWVCGLETLGSRNIKDGRNCTLYSFGVNNDSSFEAAVLITAKCSMYAYDPTVDKIGHPLKMSDPRVHFQKLGIAGANTENMRTLKTFMDENGHKFIDILKVDVEGVEYESLENIFQDFEQLPVGQLLIEFHSWSFKKDQFRQMLRYVMKLEEKGTRMFSVEANPAYPQYCAELSFINLNYLKLFLPDL